MIVGLSISLVGCANMNKQDAGVLAGGAIGGLLGSQFGGGSGKVFATVGGAIIGAAIGGVIGHNMDKTDQLEMQQALNNNRNNQPSHWVNPNNGNAYTVTPVKTYYRPNNYTGSGYVPVNTPPPVAPPQPTYNNAANEAHYQEQERRYREQEQKYREQERRLKEQQERLRNQGTPCREYYMTANIGGKKEQVYGTACRQADGSWKIEKN